MKSLPNVLRIVLVDPPTEFDGMVDVEPRIESKHGSEPGIRDAEGDVRFETAYDARQAVVGPAFRREKDGRRFVYIGWYGTKNGSRTRFRRLKIHVDSLNLVWASKSSSLGAPRMARPPARRRRS